jgi:predicted aldo/keto reductase-like oxidoreductase
MTHKNKGFSRRDFFKTAGAAGIGSVLAPYLGGVSSLKASEVNASTKVPTRPFGKTGVDVSILSLGGMFDIPSNQIILKQAIRLGVTHWDTASSYGYGQSERGIGRFFQSNPDARSQVFLVTKSGERDPSEMSKMLDTSLERMNTSYVDLYFVHGIRRISDIDNKTRAWAEDAKSKGKIRFFGFSTHSNMENCLLDASKLGWIDGIMMTYNFRIMHSDAMQEAVDACHNAGIGLTAMKTQGGGPVKTDSELELNIAGRFVQKGFTPEQAKLMAVWENPAIANICSQMPSMNLLAANAAAAMKRENLTTSDFRLFQDFDKETASDYCAGCAHLCESVFSHSIPVCDVMRYLMYARNYGDKELAINLFQEIPSEIRQQIFKADYTRAEKRCPRHLAIGKLMKEASLELV